MENQTSKSSLNLILLTISLLIVASLGTYFFLRSQKPKQQTPIQLPPLNSPTPSNNPVSDWKTYHNNEYNFSFQYPSELFQNQAQPTTNYQYWNSDSLENTDQQEVWMGMHFSSNLDSNIISIYQQIIDQEVGTNNQEQAIIKFSNLSQLNHDGAIYYQGMPSDYFEYSDKPNHSYEAFWLKESQLLRLSINSNTEQTLEKYREVFDEIVASFTINN